MVPTWIWQILRDRNFLEDIGFCAVIGSQGENKLIHMILLD